MADEKPPEKPAFDPFKPAEPRLPGVPEKKAKPPAPPAAPGPAPASAPTAGAPAAVPPVPAWMEKLPPQLRALPPATLYGGAGAIVLVLVVLLWLVFRSPEPAPAQPIASTPPRAVTSAAPPGETAPSAEPAPEVVTLPATVAATKDLAKPWAYRKFIIRQAGERVPAMVLRLPGSGGSSSAYWGFSLRAPYGRCELELITDTQKLVNEYGYNASHPMVADPCTQTLFDPLRMGSIGPSTYARGEVVQGTALRPPIAVEIRIQKGEVIAARTE